MIFFELEVADISALNDADLRELVARLCEAELIQQGMQPSCVTWGGAQEAADDGVDVRVKNADGITSPNFVPRRHTVFQVKKHSMSKSACKKEMLENEEPRAIIEDLAAQKGAYIIVSGSDNCSEKMLSDRLAGMREAVASLQHRDDLHLDFYGPDRLAAWLRRHPSVALWVRSRLGRPLAGWRPYGRWAATPSSQEDAFLLDDHPCVIDANSRSKEPKPIAEGIRLARDRLRRPGSTVRITGLSGVGKTRFSQALFEPDVGHEALPASDVIYADLGSDLTPTASELVAYLIANDFATYLVLDNCPPDVHRSLQKQVAEGGVKLRLLTIEYDISEDKPEETEVIHLEPTSEKTVSLLTQKRFPNLGCINADRIAEFAGGNARVALALASRVDADETLSNFSDEDLFKRLFSQRKESTPELLYSAEVLALVYSFNIARSERHDELKTLGAIAGLSRQVLYRDQGELFRRQIAQRRGNWQAVLPHALANRLAKRALENISPDDINAELFKPENFRLFQSCAHRLGYLHDVDGARQLALSWIQPGGPLHNIATCNAQYLTSLNYIAPIFPDVVLRVIEHASVDPQFSSRENESCITFVRLLCHIAYNDETFDRSVDVLLKFAETERDGENNNSIVKRMQQLFSLHLSGTEATPERRQAFVQKLLRSRNPRHREIAGKLLHSAFEAHHWHSFGPFHFGARKRGQGWRPSTDDEGTAWYLGYIQLLQPMLSSAQPGDRDWAKSLLASHFRGLWSFAGCFDALEQVVHDHGQGGAWPEVWISIKRTIDLDGDELSPELLARLESLEQLTAPSDLYSEIQAYALVDEWDHSVPPGQDFLERQRQIYEKATRLGEAVATQTEYLDQLGSKLWTTNAQPLSYFGQGLAIGSADRRSMFERLVESFQKNRPERSSLLLLDGYIKGVHGIDPHQARQLLEYALEVPELRPYAVNLLAMLPIPPWASQRLLELAQEGVLEAWRYERLSYGRTHESITDSELVTLLTTISILDNGWLSVAQILSMRFYGKEHRDYTPSEELRAVARATIRGLASMHQNELERRSLHGVDRILEEAFADHAPEHEIKEIIDLLCEGIETYRLSVSGLAKVIITLIKKYPELLLDAVFNREGDEGELAFMIFKERIGSRGASLNDVPLDRVLAWCGTDQERLAKVAMATHAYVLSAPQDVPDDHPKQVTLSEHIKSFLEVADNKLAIVEAIFENTIPHSWSGSRANIVETRLKAFAELLDHPDLGVQALVRTKVPLLEQMMSREREREAAEHSEREQRFE